MKVTLRKTWWLAAVILTGCLTGCSGINTTQSVSPASFFLPGLLKSEPTKRAPTDPQTPAQTELAQANH
jgi:hypothetical protein